MWEWERGKEINPVHGKVLRIEANCETTSVPVAFVYFSLRICNAFIFIPRHSAVQPLLYQASSAMHAYWDSMRKDLWLVPAHTHRHMHISLCQTREFPCLTQIKIIGGFTWFLSTFTLGKCVNMSTALSNGAYNYKKKREKTSGALQGRRWETGRLGRITEQFICLRPHGRPCFCIQRTEPSGSLGGSYS